MKSFLKIVILALSFQLSISPVHAQIATGSPIIDVSALKNKIDSLKSTTLSSTTINKLAGEIVGIINANMMPGSVKYSSYSDMMASLNTDNNRYLLKYLPAINSDTNKRGLSGAQPNMSFAGNNAAKAEDGFLSAGDVGNAIGSFIAKRFKQEVEIAFLNKFKECVNKDSILPILLPTTTVILNKNDPYQYTSFLETLKEALNKDIQNLPTNIGIFLESPIIDTSKIAENKWVFPSILVYNDLIKISSNKSPVTVINNINKDAEFMKIKDVNIQSSFRLLALISRTLTNPSANGTWLSPATIGQAFSDGEQLQLFLGLLLLKEKDELSKIKIGASNSLYTIIVNDASDISKINDVGNWLLAVSKGMTSISDAFNQIQNTYKNGSEKNITGSQVLQILNSISNTTHDVLNAPFKNIMSPDIDVIDTALAYSQKIISIFSEIKSANYGLAVMNTISVLETYKNLRESQIAIIQKYGTFAATIVDAKNSQEMIDALDAAALPVGSYRIKRNSFVDIAFNAYGGGYFGYQQFTKAVPAGVNSTNYTYGFAGPVGIAFSFGSREKITNKLKSKKKYKGDIPYSADNNSEPDHVLTGGSWSLFVPIIDVGAITAFRLTHDSTATLPNFTWQNILAPGIFIVRGFKKNPLSWGVGVQYGPQLRSIQETNSTASATILPPAVSVKAFLAIDIPIFDFYTKTEHVKSIFK